MEQREQEKQNAAKASLDYVKDGMIIGLGSGSTSEFMVRYLGERVVKGLSVKAVPSSKKIEALAKSLNIPLTKLTEIPQLDIYIDGADEIDGNFNMIKGGGGALLREKILAHNSKMRVIIVDSSKKVEQLGAFKLPIEVIPFSYGQVIVQLEQMNLKPILRKNGDQTYITDESNFILDVDILGHDNYRSLNDVLLQIPGIVETGLFLDYVDILFTGNGDEVVVQKNTKKPF